MMMCQIDKENSIEFARRVVSVTKLCDYRPDDEMEAVVRAITKCAIDGRVLVLAHRNWVKQGSMKDFIDLVREIDLVRNFNELSEAGKSY